MDITFLIYNEYIEKLEAQWIEPVSSTFPSALRKLNTQPSMYMLPTKFRFIWLGSCRGDCLDIDQS